MADSMSWDGEQYLPDGYQPTDRDGDGYADAGSYAEADDYAAADEAPAVWQDPDQRYAEGGREALGRRDQRRDRVRRRAQVREARWQHNRLAVPYRTDGPRVTFGVLWFAVIVGLTIWSSPLLLSMVLALVAGMAGLQMGHAWFPDFPATKWWTAFAAVVAGVSGFIGPIGIAMGVALGSAMLLLYTLVNPGHRRTFAELIDVLLRSSIPVGLAAASLAGLANIEIGAIMALVLLVSAYEVGDFLIGSGSANAVEGPITGLVALGAALFMLWVVAPAPFTDRSMLLFGALAAVCCPLGQILASALLPRGNAWAPALRRLDSYLLAAPLWLLLLETSPTASSL